MSIYLSMTQSLFHFFVFGSLKSFNSLFVCVRASLKFQIAPKANKEHYGYLKI